MDNSNLALNRKNVTKLLFAWLDAFSSHRYCPQTNVMRTKKILVLITPPIGYMFFSVWFCLSRHEDWKQLRSEKRVCRKNGSWTVNSSTIYIRAFNVHEIITSMYKFSRDRKHRSKPIIMSKSKLYILIYMILTESSSIDRLSMDELFIEHIT